MKDILLHPASEELLNKMSQQQPHAVLFVASKGAGKGFVTSAFAADILSIPVSRLLTNPYVKVIKPVDGVISIDVIRDVHQFLRLKTTGNKLIRRIVIIEDADTMTLEAQNAILKLLEEPPADTVLLLSAASRRSLRPTIISRTQVVELLPPAKEATMAYFVQKGYPNIAIERAFSISRGNIGILSTLLESDEHELLVSIDQAKGILKASTYERLCQADSLSKQKPEAISLLDGLARVCGAALERSATKNTDTKTTKSWLKRLKAVQFAQSSSVRNPSMKLLLTDLFLQL